MITCRSLTNKRRRLPELRKLQRKLRSLKHKRFARRVFSRTFGKEDELAIVHLLDNISDFLRCSFNEIKDDAWELHSALKAMYRAIEQLKNECIQCAVKGFTISSSTVRCFGSASTRLYQISRRESLNFECDVFWHRVGLCFHAIF